MLVEMENKTSWLNAIKETPLFRFVKWIVEWLRNIQSKLKRKREEL